MVTSTIISWLSSGFLILFLGLFHTTLITIKVSHSNQELEGSLETHNYGAEVNDLVMSNRARPCQRLKHCFHWHIASVLFISLEVNTVVWSHTHAPSSSMPEKKRCNQSIMLSCSCQPERRASSSIGLWLLNSKPLSAEHSLELVHAKHTQHRTNKCPRKQTCVRNYSQKQNINLYVTHTRSYLIMYHKTHVLVVGQWDIAGEVWT